MIPRLIAKRAGLAVFTLLSVSVLIFVFTSVLPGDIAERVLGRESTADQRQIFRERLQLDRPMPMRYALWLEGVVTGDLGKSLVNQRPIAAVMGPAGANTLLLGAYAFVLYIPITLLAAISGALFRDRAIDVAVSFLTLVGLSLPEFIVGTLFILLFAVELPLFPALAFLGPESDLGTKLYVLALPATTLAIGMAVYAIRMLRDSLIEVLESEYVLLAKLKGVPRALVVLRHALPNAIVPALNVTGLNLTSLIGGVVVVEEVFSYPGLGKLFIDAISVRDVPLVEAIALLGSAVYIAANFVVDVLAALLNPRIRVG